MTAWLTPPVLWALTGFNLAIAGVVAWQLCVYPWLRPRPDPYVPHAQQQFWFSVVALGVNLGWVVFRIWTLRVG